MKMTILIIIAVIFFVGIIFLDFYYTSKIWNNGKCKCGGNWKHTYALDEDHYIYKCDKCSKETVLNKYIEE